MTWWKRQRAGASARARAPRFQRVTWTWITNYLFLLIISLLGLLGVHQRFSTRIWTSSSPAKRRTTRSLGAPTAPGNPKGPDSGPESSNFRGVWTFSPIPMVWRDRERLVNSRSVWVRPPNTFLSDVHFQQPGIAKHSKTPRAFRKKHVQI